MTALPQTMARMRQHQLMLLARQPLRVVLKQQHRSSLQQPRRPDLTPSLMLLPARPRKTTTTTCLTE